MTILRDVDCLMNVGHPRDGDHNRDRDGDCPRDVDLTKNINHLKDTQHQKFKGIYRNHEGKIAM